MQTRPQLLETVWEAQPDIQTRTVDMHVQRLRTKLGEAGEHDRDGPRLRLSLQRHRAGGARAVTLRPPRWSLGTHPRPRRSRVLVARLGGRARRCARDLEGDIAPRARARGAAGPRGAPGRLRSSWQAHRPPALRSRPGTASPWSTATGRVRADSDFPPGPLPADREPRAAGPRSRAALAGGTGSRHAAGARRSAAS